MKRRIILLGTIICLMTTGCSKGVNDEVERRVSVVEKPNSTVEINKVTIGNAFRPFMDGDGLNFKDKLDDMWDTKKAQFNVPSYINDYNNNLGDSIGSDIDIDYKYGVANNIVTFKTKYKEFEIYYNMLDKNTIHWIDILPEYNMKYEYDSVERAKIISNILKTLGFDKEYTHIEDAAVFEKDSEYLDIGNEWVLGWIEGDAPFEHYELKRKNDKLEYTVKNEDLFNVILEPAFKKSGLSINYNEFSNIIETGGEDIRGEYLNGSVDNDRIVFSGYSGDGYLMLENDFIIDKTGNISIKAKGIVSSTVADDIIYKYNKYLVNGRIGRVGREYNVDDGKFSISINKKEVENGNIDLSLSIKVGGGN